MSTMKNKLKTITIAPDTDCERFAACMPAGKNGFNLVVRKISSMTRLNIGASECFFRLPQGASATIDVFDKDPKAALKSLVFDFKVSDSEATFTPSDALARDWAKENIFKDSVPFREESPVDMNFCAAFCEGELHVIVCDNPDTTYLSCEDTTECTRIN